MTGRTHDQIAVAGALAASTALQLPLEHTAIMVCGAYAVARGPDYIEPLFKWLSRVAHRDWTGHRTVTHYLPTGLAVAVAWLAVLAAVGAPLAIAAAWAGGILTGWSLHSLADALTDKGCWLILRRRQVLLPDARTFKVLWWHWTIRPRIKVYTITTRKHWLTRKVTTTKRPSAGERAYLFAATLAVWAFAAVQVVMVARTILNPHA